MARPAVEERETMSRLKSIMLWLMTAIGFGLFFGGSASSVWFVYRTIVGRDSWIPVLGSLFGACVGSLSVFLGSFMRERGFALRGTVNFDAARRPIRNMFFLAIYVLDFMVFGHYLTQEIVTPPQVGSIEQLFGCVVTAGILGGLVAEFAVGLREPSSALKKILGGVSFWRSLFNICVSAVTAVVLCLLVRGGILSTGELKEHNLYGITGMALINGVFAQSFLELIRDRLIGKLGSETGSGSSGNPSDRQPAAPVKRR